MELIQRGSKNNGPGHGELLAGFSPPGERDHRCALCGHRSSWNGLGPLGTPWDRADPARSRYAVGTLGIFVWQDQDKFDYINKVSTIIFMNIIYPHMILIYLDDTVDGTNPASPTGCLKPELNNGMFTTVFNCCRILLAHPQQVRVCLNTWNMMEP